MTNGACSKEQKSCKNKELPLVRWAEKGASLISMSMFIMTLGFLITGFLVMYNKQVSAEKAQISAERQAEIQHALDVFIQQNGRLPCPASLTDGIDTANFGREVANCSTFAFAPGPGNTLNAAGIVGSGGAGFDVYTGAVPVRTLGLPDEYIIDAHQKRFTYAVTGAFTVAGADFNAGAGDITVQDTAGNALGGAGGTAIFALITPGEDDRGTYAFNGQQIQACGATGAAADENCDWGANGTFTDSLFKQQDVGAGSFTQSVAFKSSNIIANWFRGPWGACAPNCSTGTQTRVVECQNQAGQAVPDNFCPGARGDITINTHETQPCGAAGVAACTWSPVDWGSCSPICGDNSFRYGTSQCVDGSGTILTGVDATNHCGPAPVLQEACVIGNVYDGVEHVDCEWYQSGWSACSETCGSGIQTRTVECVRDDNGNGTGELSETDVADSLCSGSKPDEQQSCSMGTCAWQTGSWSACDPSCGPGTQNRSVSCERDSDGEIQPESYCSGTRPSASQSCNDGPCVTYSWEAGAWGDCSAACGTGQQIRSIVCRGSDGSVGSDSQCSGTRPISTQDCNTQSCSGCGWVQTTSELDTNQPLNQCNDSSTQFGSEWAAVGSTSQDPDVDCPSNPSAGAECELLDSCNNDCGQNDSCLERVTYEYVPCATNGACNNSARNACSSGTANDNAVADTAQEYRWICEGAHGGTDSAMCSTSTGISYSWFAGVWNTCSESCGGGTQTRLVECRDNNGNTVPESNCSGTKPAASQSCNTQACAPNCTWQGGYTYGTSPDIQSAVFTMDCGPVHPTNIQGTANLPFQSICTPGAACDPNASPHPCLINQRSCSDSSMGDSGIDATIWDRYECSCNGPPTPPSPPPVTYSWNQGSWGSCSATCDGGTQTRAVTCRDSMGNTVPDSNCSGSKPTTSQSCNTQACASQCTISRVDADWSNSRGTTNGCRNTCQARGLVSVRVNIGGASRLCDSNETNGSYPGRNTSLYWEDNSLRCYATGQRHDGDRSDKARYCYCATDLSCNGTSYTPPSGGGGGGGTDPDGEPWDSPTDMLTLDEEM